MHPVILEMLVTERIDRLRNEAQAARRAREARTGARARQPHRSWIRMLWLTAKARGGYANRRNPATLSSRGSVCLGPPTGRVPRRTDRGVAGAASLIIGGLVPFACGMYALARSGQPAHLAIVMITLLISAFDR